MTDPSKAKREDGGPAFPRVTTETITGSPGMSLRDYFAGQALLVLADNAEGLDEFGSAARTAYRLADAMLAERGKP